MKRDIRDLFKKEDELKTLPENHRVEFLDKLKKIPKQKSNTFFWFSSAAVVLIALTIGFNMFFNQTETEVSPMIAQIEAVEAEYLKDIENEWNNFVALAKDEVLVERFRKRFVELDKDYQEISIQFKNDTNNLLVIEALIDNLQTRLKLLKDIQKHIKILNQNNEQNENKI
ncbi:hypothetical protein [Winogradskyella sp.]|uniref:hypothetical protein n=1 Tax=Winogradskyella sp. TaxID=1883156 RepID=UPI003F6CAD28